MNDYEPSLLDLIRNRKVPTLVTRCFLAHDSNVTLQFVSLKITQSEKLNRKYQLKYLSDIIVSPITH